MAEKRIKLRFADAGRDWEYAAFVWPPVKGPRFTVWVDMPPGGRKLVSPTITADSLDRFADDLARQADVRLCICFEAEGGAVVGHLFWPRPPEDVKAGVPVQVMDSRGGGTARVADDLDQLATKMAEV